MRITSNYPAHISLKICRFSLKKLWLEADTSSAAKAQSAMASFMKFHLKKE